MTSTIPQKFIKINMQETVKYQKKLKENRWKCYDVKIIKDSREAIDEVKKMIEKREIR